MQVVDLADLEARSLRDALPDRFYSWWNISSSYNGTDIEGNQSLDIGDFFFQQIVANNIAVAALTLYGWEYISTLYDEIQLYKTQKLFSRHVILFLLVRYGTLPSLILPAFSVWHNFSNDVNGCLQHQQLTICVVQLIASIVFAWRTIAIWGHGRKITIFFIVIVCLQFGASFGLLWFSEDQLLPNGACMPVTPKNGFNPLPPFYAIAFAYDLLTMCMSSLRLWQFSALGRQETVWEPLQWSQPSVFARRIWTRVKTNLQAMSESPLIERITHAGLVYFLVASSFNGVALALEASKNVHSKAIITLYAPLMCILCQRIILLDVKTIWGGASDKNNSGSREQVLIDRVMGEKRLSWQGSDVESSVLPHPSTITSEKIPEESSSRHVAVNMATGEMGFEDMLHQEPAACRPSRLVNWTTFGRRRDNSTADATSMSTPSIVESFHQSQQPEQSQSSEHTMSDEDRLTALRLAGFTRRTKASSEPDLSMYYTNQYL